MMRNDQKMKKCGLLKIIKFVSVKKFSPREVLQPDNYYLEKCIEELEKMCVLHDVEGGGGGGQGCGYSWMSACYEEGLMMKEICVCVTHEDHNIEIKIDGLKQYVCVGENDVFHTFTSVVKHKIVFL